MEELFSQYMARFQNLPPFNIHKMVDDGRATTPWYDVHPSEHVIPELVIDELNLAHQVQTVTGQIHKWGRLESIAKRVWQIAERRYRVWRSKFFLEKLSDPDVTIPTPKEKSLEAMMRLDPGYEEHQLAIEQAEEAHTATEHILSAWREKSRLLQRFVQKHRDSAQPVLTV
jgi:hypothetical protein